MSKNILITGTSSGIGFCCAKLFADFGHTVFAGVRAENDFEKLQNLSTNIKPIFLDVLDDNSINSAVKELKNRNIELEVILNNAGAVIAQPIECINIDDLRYQFEINTIAPVKIAQAFMPLMKSGKIINISSMSSSGIFPYIAPYCASKRALDILFNSMSIELKNKDIKIVSIKPGSIKTPIWNKSIVNNQKSLDKLSVEFKKKYEKDLVFLAQNAESNNYNAIEPIKVAKKILRIIQDKKVKSSYCIGLDSHFACLIGKLPQDMLNSIIKFQLKRKLKKV